MEKYEPIEMEIIAFDAGNVIVTSYEVISFDVGEVIVASFPDAPVLPPAPIERQ